MKRSNIKKSLFFTVTIGFLVVTLSLSTMQSCKKTETPTTVSGPTLYDSLGGTTLVQDPTAASGTMIEKGRLGIRSVIDSTIFIIAADNQINGSFAVLLAEVGASNFSGYTALTNNFTDFMCVAAGAKDFTYGGRSMSDAHNPAYNPRMTGKVSSAAFNEFVNDVVAGANKNAVPSYLIASVGKLLATTESQVVQE